MRKITIITQTLKLYAMCCDYANVYIQNRNSVILYRHHKSKPLQATKEVTAMKKAERVSEIIEAMKSFGKDKYQKSERLGEMFALQREIVELTFNGEHASTADLKIWDVERHLEQMNQDCGNVAYEALQAFKNGSKTLCNLIKAEISGKRGEEKAFRALQYVKSKNIVLQNIELKDGDLRTELDAVVIMPGTIVIVEVKNTAKDIFIDENGDYYRTGEFLKRDCNIAEKMLTKEDLLRKALESKGIRNVQIRSVVVFTDNRIEVQNKYSPIRTCFVSQLAYIIDGFNGGQMMTDEEMDQIESAIKAAESKGAYPFGFDVQQYKKDFAMLMATLEEASAIKESAAMEEDVVIDTKESAWARIKSFLKSRYAGYIGSAAAVAAVTIFSVIAFNTIKKGGILR